MIIEMNFEPKPAPPEEVRGIVDFPVRNNQSIRPSGLLHSLTPQEAADYFLRIGNELFPTGFILLGTYGKPYVKDILIRDLQRDSRGRRVWCDFFFPIFEPVSNYEYVERSVASARKWYHHDPDNWNYFASFEDSLG